VLLGAATSVVAEESAAPEKAGALPPVSSLSAGTTTEVVELCSASPHPPSSGVWGPAPRRRSHHRAVASGTWTPPLGCSARTPPPVSRRPSRPGRHPHCPCGGAPAPAPCLFPSRRGPDLRDLAPRDLGWCAAGGRVQRRGCGSRDWGRLPTTGPSGHPRRGSASTLGPSTATPGPRTGL
jgi:hypothetical protein